MKRLFFLLLVISSSIFAEPLEPVLTMLVAETELPRGFEIVRNGRVIGEFSFPGQTKIHRGQVFVIYDDSYNEYRVLFKYRDSEGQVRLFRFPSNVCRMLRHLVKNYRRSELKVPTIRYGLSGDFPDGTEEGDDMEVRNGLLRKISAHFYLGTANGGHGWGYLEAGDRPMWAWQGVEAVFEVIDAGATYTRYYRSPPNGVVASPRARGRLCFRELIGDGIQGFWEMIAIEA